MTVTATVGPNGVNIHISQTFQQHITNVEWGGLIFELFVRAEVAKQVFGTASPASVAKWPVEAVIPGVGLTKLYKEGRVNTPNANVTGAAPSIEPDPSAKEVIQYYKAWTFLKDPPSKITLFEAISADRWLLDIERFGPPPGYTDQIVIRTLFRSWLYDYMGLPWNTQSAPVFHSLAEAQAAKAAWFTYAEARLSKPPPDADLEYLGYHVADITLLPGYGPTRERVEDHGQWNYFKLSSMTFPKDSDGKAQPILTFDIKWTVKFPPATFVGPHGNTPIYDAVYNLDVRARLLKIKRGNPNAVPPVESYWPPYPEWDTVSVSRRFAQTSDFANNPGTIKCEINREAETVKLTGGAGLETAPAEQLLPVPQGEFPKVPAEPPRFPKKPDYIEG